MNKPRDTETVLSMILDALLRIESELKRANRGPSVHVSSFAPQQPVIQEQPKPKKFDVTWAGGHD